MIIIADVKSRKYQLTINNPEKNNFTHERINNIIQANPFVYYCLCDEVGENGTPHTHIYICFKNAVHFSTMKKRFPTAHIEQAIGSSQENKDYIRKEGKYLGSEKKSTNLIETFEEYGEIPLDKATKNEKASEQVLRLIKEGASNVEIIEAVPSYCTKIPQLEQLRQTIVEEENKDTWRDLEIIYIYGKTATGKTRYVMDNYGYSNVCKITNYKNPFDRYHNEDVILFDEFRDSIPLKDMLQYLDGYPCSLPARYADKVACYTKVYIISNIPLNEQFKWCQEFESESWNAFVRRISKVYKFEKDCQIEELVEDYLI